MPEVTGRFAAWRRTIAEALLGFSIADDPDTDADLFRRLTDKKASRDLDSLSHSQMLRICNWLYDSNALGAWLVDRRVELVLGDELGYVVEIDAARANLSKDEARALEDEIRFTLDRFWDSPLFSIRTRADELLTSYLVSAELCLPIAAENEIDGVPQLDFLDSSLIKAVHPLEGSSLVAAAVELKSPEPAKPGRRLEIIRHRPASGRLEGECFFWRNARLANAMRGRSDLLTVADWLDSFDQYLFARADRAPLMNAAVWDVTLTGATKKQVDDRAKAINQNPPVKPLSVRVHNEKEKWEPIVPDLKSEDATAEGKLLRNYILGAKGIPESWFSDGGGVTRTTAGEQNDVALQALRSLRKRVRAMFGQMLSYAYDRAERRQADWPSRASGAVKVFPDLPPLAERDVSRLGGVVQNVVGALELAVAEELVSAQTARKVLLHIVDRLGVPVDPDQELRQIEAERSDRELGQVDRANQRALDRLAAAVDA